MLFDLDFNSGCWYSKRGPKVSLLRRYKRRACQDEVVRMKLKRFGSVSIGILYEGTLLGPSLLRCAINLLINAEAFLRISYRADVTYLEVSDVLEIRSIHDSLLKYAIVTRTMH